MRHLFIFLTLSSLVACGGSSVSLSAPESTPTDNLAVITSADSGDSEDIPSTSESSSTELILSCDSIATDGSVDENNVTVTCTVSDEEVEYVYYCQDEVIYRDDGDGATQLYQNITVTCENDDGPMLSDEELIIS